MEGTYDDARAKEVVVEAEVEDVVDRVAEGEGDWEGTEVGKGRSEVGSERTDIESAEGCVAAAKGRRMKRKDGCMMAGESSWAGRQAVSRDMC